MFWKHCSRLKNQVVGSDVEHVLRLFKNFLKIWFSAKKSGSRLRCRTMLKKNILKHPENTNKTCFEAFWEILENPFLGSKMWFSAQISNYAKIPWNTQKTPSKHVLRLFNFFFENPVLGSKIRFSAQMSNNAKKYFETLRKHQLNTLWGILRSFWKSDSWLKNPVLGSYVE